MGRKVGAVPFLGGAGFPPNTMWPGQRPTSMTNFILFHPTVWPQYTNVTDKQARKQFLYCITDIRRNNTR